MTTIAAAGDHTIAPALIEDADAAVAMEVEPVRDTASMQFVAVASKIGDQPPMRLLCAATVAIGLLSARPRLARAGLRMIVAHTVATAAKNFLKRRVDRTRPNARAAGDDHRLRLGNDVAHAKSSFPSGHSAGAVAVGAAFAREFPGYRTGALAVAGTVALAQVPRGSHYLSDVIVGSGIGAASEAALNGLALLMIGHRHRLGEDGRETAKLQKLEMVQEAARHVR